jgi:uncharacterized protein
MTRGRVAGLGIALLAIVTATTAAVAGPEIPYLTGRVVDEANILSQDSRDRLTAMLKAHEEATTNQVVVLTVPSVGDTSIEEYAVKVFETWKLGQKGKDNGVLVVVAPHDRKLRIEVGYGLEATLPDGAAGDIIRTWMTPAFKAGDYDKGVEDGVAAIVARLEGRGGPVDRTPIAAPASSSSGGFTPIPMPQRLFIGLFVFSILGLFTVIGITTPGLGWFLYFFLIPFWSLFPLAIIGPHPTLYLIFTYLAGFPLVKLAIGRTGWYEKAAADLKSKGTTSIGGFTVSSGSSGGGWSSSSSSGGSFSGGGGSSGGGGASGSW